MPGVSIQIEGLDGIAAMLNAADRELIGELDRGVDRSAQIVRDDTKLLAPVSAKTTGYTAIGIPVDTGRMRQSIQEVRSERLAADVVAQTEYSGFVQEGTSRMPGRNFFQWALDGGSLGKINTLFDDILKKMFGV